jgi:hypothetical protein
VIGVVAAARQASAWSKRWTRAVETAYNWLLENEAADYDPHSGYCEIPSLSRPWIRYISNAETCGCEAHIEQNVPCWHRALARIIYQCYNIENDPLFSPASGSAGTAAEPAATWQPSYGRPADPGDWAGSPAHLHLV